MAKKDIALLQKAKDFIDSATHEQLIRFANNLKREKNKEGKIKWKRYSPHTAIEDKENN